MKKFEILGGCEKKVGTPKTPSTPSLGMKKDRSLRLIDSLNVLDSTASETILMYCIDLSSVLQVCVYLRYIVK